MDPSFGARLRTQREKQQVSLSTISAELKIKLSLLEGLESDHLTHWPKGIFGRSYLRSYARAIGLDPEPVVREYLELYPDAPDDPFSKAKDAEEAPVAPPPAAKLRRLVSAAMSAVPVLRQRDSRLPSTTAALREPSPDLLDIDQTVPAEFSAVAHTHDAHGANGNGTNGNGAYGGGAYGSDVDRGSQEDPAGMARPPADTRDAVHPVEERVPAYAESRERRLGHDRRQLNMTAAADICSRLARALDWNDVTRLLAEAAALLDAVGVIVWLRDPQTTALRAAVAHGYSDAMIASLPDVQTTESNAIAAAFRSGEACLVEGAEGTTGAVVVPSMGPSGCVAVLALEVRDGGERRECVRAFATILAAQLGMLIPSAPAPAPAT
jgi:hypothetical protein